MASEQERTSNAPGGSAAARWENEGGARRASGPEPVELSATPGRSAGGNTPDSVSEVVEYQTAPRVPERAPNTPKQDAAQDARQDRIMAVVSPDGRPPKRGLRRRGWSWFIGSLALLTFVSIIYAVRTGAQTITVVMAIVLLTILFAAAVPAWGAGLLRGREQRRAHRAAQRGRDEPPFTP